MRTKIDSSWIVGHDNGEHRLIRDGVIVFEDKKIVFVGKKFEGNVDRTISAKGKLVCPGFIDTHVHSGHRAAHRLISDTGRPLFFGQPFLEVSVPKNKKTSSVSKVIDPEDERKKSALFTVAELIRNGVTTFIEYGSGISVQNAILEQAIALGSRAYLGPGYDCGRFVGDEKGRLKRVQNDSMGIKSFEKSLNWIREKEGMANGRIRGILVPREVETCSLDVLRKTLEAADEFGFPMATHAAYSVIEFHEIVKEHMKTPIELLSDLGMLRPTLNIGHGNFISDNPNLNYAKANDLKLMGDSGVTVSHCPTNIIRRGRNLNSWEKYRSSGVNLTIGTDTYPRDMIMNMRTASYMGKLMSNSYFAAQASEVFNAATIGGAVSVGRNDIGKLEVGALADIIIIDLKGNNSLRYGPVRDPIKSLVECGVGDDVETVFVDGRIIMEDRKIPDINFAEISRDIQEIGKHFWSDFKENDPLGRTDVEACPWCYEMDE